MEILSKLFGQGTEITKQEIEDANVCPNCWGKQEYENQYKDYVNDSTKSNINHDKQNRKAFIAQFVETYVTGIKLKNKDGEKVCPVCQYTNKI